MDDVAALPQKPSSNRSQLNAEHHLATRKCFRQSSALSVDDLSQWHEAYKAADGQSLCAEDAVIKQVQSDGLDEAAIEVLPVIRPQVDGGEVDVLAHLHTT